MPSFSRAAQLIRAAAFVLPMLVIAPLAHAAADDPMGVVDLQGAATTEVAPDLAVLTLTAERTGPDSAKLTADVSRTLEAALRSARAVPGVQARSGGFSTQPHWTVHDGKSAQDGWTVRGTLVLKSDAFDALGKLAGQLAQGGMMVTSSGFEVSPALSHREQTRLIAEAIADFKANAAVAAKALGYPGYHLRSLRIEPVQGDSPQPRPVAMMRLAVAADAAAPSVPLDSGLTTLRLQVNGSVQLDR